MNPFLNRTNENINYINYTNSSAILWSSSSADPKSVATRTRNQMFLLSEERRPDACLKEISQPTEQSSSSQKIEQFQTPLS
jgi:hypothetical protein